MKGALAVCVLMVSLCPVSSNGGRLDIALEHPAPGIEFEYVPNVPLWLRIRKGETQVTCANVYIPAYGRKMCIHTSMHAYYIHAYMYTYLV